MANVKKIQINVDVQAAFDSAIKQIENFKKQLNTLSLPKTITKDLEKDLTNYQKSIQKALNFKPTTGNLNEYRNIINSISNNFNTLINKISNIDDATNEAFNSNKEIDNYKNKIKSLREEIEQLDKQTKAYYGVTSADSKAKRDAAKDKKKIDTDTREEKGTLSGAALEATRKKQEEMTDALTRGVKKRKELQEAEEKLQEATEKNNAAQEQAVKDAEKVKEGFNGVSSAAEVGKKSYQEFAKEAANLATQERVQDLTNTLKRWTAFGVAIGYARNQLIQMKETYLELDASLTQIAVVSGKTRDQMWNMIGTYNEMAQRLGATTAQVVESSKLYFQQGRSQSEVMELVEQTTILAAISELDFADATNYLTAAINGFKLEAEDAVNVTDIWANLAAKAAVDTQELAVAISKVASIAKSAGADIETTSAFLTKMINFATYTRVA